MDFKNEKVFVLFKKLFFPTLAGMLCLCAVTAADGIFVGRGVGGDGIAAVNICVPLMMVVMGFGLMVGIGGSVVAAVSLSKGKIKRARFNVTQAMLFVTGATAVLIAAVMIFPFETARLLGASDHLTDMVVTYLRWFVPALVFQIWGAVALFYIRLDGAPKLAMWCNIVPALLNVFLDWLFIFPFRWGVMGAAFASSISVFTGGTAAVVYLLFFAKTLRFYPVKIGARGFHLFFENIWKQCKIGSSALLGESTMAMLMFTGNRVFMRYLGDDGVGAFGIGCYYMPFAFMVGSAIAQSAQPIVSFNYGLGDRRRIVQTEKVAAFAGVLCGAASTLFFTLFPATAVGLFLDARETAAKLAVDGLPFFTSGFVFFILNLTGIGYFQSVERLTPATVFSLLRGFVFLTASFHVMPLLFGTKGIWLAMPVSETATFLTMAAYCLIKKRY